MPKKCFIIFVVLNDQFSDFCKQICRKKIEKIYIKIHYKVTRLKDMNFSKLCNFYKPINRAIIHFTEFLSIYWLVEITES
jgi:hypothetical protein